MYALMLDFERILNIILLYILLFEENEWKKI